LYCDDRYLDHLCQKQKSKREQTGEPGEKSAG
jgi:hypothetical protein